MKRSILNDTVVCRSQSGEMCRLTSYTSLLKKARFLYSFYERLFDRKIEASNKIMNGFRHPVEPLHTLREIAKKAEKIVIAPR